MSKWAVATRVSAWAASPSNGTSGADSVSGFPVTVLPRLSCVLVVHLGLNLVPKRMDTT